MIPAQVYCRVVRFKGESGLQGAGFFVDGPRGLALVTAAHNCSGDREEYVEFQQAAGDYSPVGALLERRGDIASPIDVAVYDVPENLRPQWYVGSVDPIDQGLIWGQDCFILGYPYLMAGKAFGGGSELPMIKKAIISGQVVRDQTDFWIVDTIANPGFSGGPLIFQVNGTRDYRLAGVVIQAMTGPISATDPSHGPAGFSVCIGSRHIRELIE